MKSKKIKHLIMKLLLVSTIFTGYISNHDIVNASTTLPMIITEDKRPFEKIQDFSNSIISSGKELIDSYKNYDEVKFVKAHYLPIEGEENSTMQLIDPNSGELIQTRIYDSNGNAAMDIDYTSHGDGAFTDSIHKHIWKDGVRQLNKDLTKKEYIKYSIIPKSHTDSAKRFTPLYDFEEEIGIKISYDEFVEAINQNRDIKLKINDITFNITYGKNKNGNPTYKVIYLEPFLGNEVLEYKTFDTREDLLRFKFKNYTFEQLWKHVGILSIN